MAESQTSTATMDGGERGGRNPRGRAGRHRGGRGGRGGRGRGGGASAAATGQQNQSSEAAPAAAGTASSTHTQPHSGRGSRRRGNANPRRGGTNAGQRPTFGSQRTFGGQLTSGPQREAEEQNPSGSLSVDAHDFVPGQSSHEARITADDSFPKGMAKHVRRGSRSTAADLATRIHEDITNGQYECVICTNEILPNSKIWSCTTCWTVVHMSCVRTWHKNQTKKPEQPGAQAPSGWRCPGCNSTMTDEPSTYHCWCHKEVNPKSIPGLPPHSCGQTCSKPRSTCPHPCGSMICHAGPCPPCEMMGPSIPCFCGKQVSSKRCTETDYVNGWTCQEVCGDLLACGEHECSQPCHPGLCGSCEILVPSLCYCGKEFKEIPCERRGDREASFNHGQLTESPAMPQLQESWFTGSFNCDAECGRPFDCGQHRCEQKCHVQDEQPHHCPFSADVVTHCPCGKTPLTELIEEPRQSCSDGIPNCHKICDKDLPCGHKCQDICHDSACPPCLQHMEITCRCGRTTSKTVCHQGSAQVPECMRVCRAQLNCGRHLHDLHCCPGEKKAIARMTAKRKKKNLGTSNEEVESEHICIRQCGRPLKCGQHECQLLCHSGPCASCPEAVFDEVSCHCGRTVLQPPQPCGTRPPECRFDCVRDRTCGHPPVSHHCHPDDVPCPPCPFLVEKTCICGKQNLKNQRCWFEEPRCGTICGKKLKCGTHLCTKPCHRPGECEDMGIRGSHCSQPCLKVRKSCDHVDTDQCHAPFACNEDKPCQAKTFVTCECQHRKQEVKCQASKSNPWPERAPLKCDEECLRLQRNAKLAAALNIDPATHTDDHVPYSETTLKFFRDNAKWAQTYEREFRVFASDPTEKRVRFKPMKSHLRAFLHSLAEDFGLDSESQDPEPHRHVSIFKTPRFVSAPTKTLGQCVKIRDTEAQMQQTQGPNIIVPTEPYNALILSSPQFGLTIEELESSLRTDLATQPSISFKTSFLPSDEIVLRGSGAWTPQALEASVTALKPLVAQTVSRLGFAKTVSLCHVDASLNVLRREADAAKSSAGGWSTVVGRSAARPANAAPPTPAPTRSKFVALLRPSKKNKVEEPQPEPVDDDWEAAAEKLDDVDGEQ